MLFKLLHFINEIFSLGALKWSSLQKRVNKSTANKFYQIKSSTQYIKRFLSHLSHRDISLLCSRIHFKWISLCYCVPLGAKTILSQSHFWRRLLPLFFLIRFFDPDQPYIAVLKHVILISINYLETWLRSDNTSCYNTFFVGCTILLLKIILQGSEMI